MHSVKLTTAKLLSVLFVALGLQLGVYAQENSPYSRYGLGDITPGQNIFSRGMGGISAGVADNRSINFSNPASLTYITNTVLDIGLDIDYRTLKSSVPAKKFTSANTYISYLQMAFPVTSAKMRKKGLLWAMSFGLKPVTKINYKIQTNERLSGIDSLQTIYEGSGGVNQAYLGTAIRYKNFSIGINGGYMFGTKDYSTKLGFINDTVYYYQSNSENKTSFGGLFINGGIQYDMVLAKDEKGIPVKNLRLGVFGNMQYTLNASNDLVRETIVYDQSGGFYRIDSIYAEKDKKGKIKYPASIGFGAVYQDDNWTIGAEANYGTWSTYRYYGQADAVQNNYTARAGVQFYPAKENTPVKKYFNFVKYRAGLYYGNDYIKTTANRPEYGFTLGAGMPLTTLRRISYNGEYVLLNTALEVGNRGNKQTNLRENLVRFSIGISMNARWFQKPKYN